MQTTLSTTVISFTIVMILFLYYKKIGATPNRKQSILMVMCTTLIIFATIFVLINNSTGDGTTVVEAVPPTSPLPVTTIFGSDLLIDLTNVVVINLLVLDIFSFVKSFKKRLTIFVSLSLSFIKQLKN